MALSVVAATPCPDGWVLSEDRCFAFSATKLFHDHCPDACKRLSSSAGMGCIRSASQANAIRTAFESSGLRSSRCALLGNHKAPATRGTLPNHEGWNQCPSGPHDGFIPGPEFWIEDANEDGCTAMCARENNPSHPNFTMNTARCVNHYITAENRRYPCLCELNAGEPSEAYAALMLSSRHINGRNIREFWLVTLLIAFLPAIIGMLVSAILQFWSARARHLAQLHSARLASGDESENDPLISSASLKLSQRVLTALTRSKDKGAISDLLTHTLQEEHTMEIINTGPLRLLQRSMHVLKASNDQGSISEAVSRTLEDELAAEQAERAAGRVLTSARLTARRIRWAVSGGAVSLGWAFLVIGLNWMFVISITNRYNAGISPSYMLTSMPIGVAFLLLSITPADRWGIAVANATFFTLNILLAFICAFTAITNVFPANLHAIMYLFAVVFLVLSAPLALSLPCRRQLPPSRTVLHRLWIIMRILLTACGGLFLSFSFVGNELAEVREPR